jgi:signal transduction histidine kinase
MPTPIGGSFRSPLFQVVFLLSQSPADADSKSVANVSSQPVTGAPPLTPLGNPPRLVLRFAIYTGLVLLAAGLAILWTVNREVATRAQQTVEAQAQSYAGENLRRQLVKSDFTKPVSGKRLAALDELFRQRILVPGIVGTRLFNGSGTITYAARHQLIGTKVPYPKDVRDVFAGMSKRRVTRAVTWHGQRNVKVVQSLIPVRAAASTKPIGALELDQDYRAAVVSIDSGSDKLALILTVALLVLYLTLFPILRRVTGELASRNRRLREHALERGSLLEAERSARTEAESIQRLLAEQNERLRELDRMKDEFVSLVSHELRTPLTSIRGYVELLLEEGAELTSEQQRFLGVVDRNSGRLLDLVGDLLFLAQVDAGKIAVELEEVDLAQVVREAVEAFRPMAEARNIELSTEIEHVPPLLADPARLAQVLDNLVSNGLKFTPEGGRVEVGMAAIDGTVVLKVEDTGLGIPAAEQPRLFERFFRSSSATENAIPGTGLGLTITKAIVERHGGRISLDSAEDKGTTVRVELPINTRDGAVISAAELAA